MNYILTTDVAGRGTTFRLGSGYDLAGNARTETRAERIARLEELGTMAADCNYSACRERYAAPDPAMVFAEHHTASDRCESGKHNHCTCDTCF